MPARRSFVFLLLTLRSDSYSRNTWKFLHCDWLMTQHLKDSEWLPVTLEDRMCGNSLKKHLMLGHCLLEGCQVLCLQLLLHLVKFLLKSSVLTGQLCVLIGQLCALIGYLGQLTRLCLSQFLELLSGCLKVRSWWLGRNDEASILNVLLRMIRSGLKHLSFDSAGLPE